MSTSEVLGSTKQTHKTTMDHIWHQFIQKAIRQKTQIVSTVSEWHFSSVGVLTKYSSSQETHLGCAESILIEKPIRRSQYVF